MTFSSNWFFSDCPYQQLCQQTPHLLHCVLRALLPGAVLLPAVNWADYQQLPSFYAESDQPQELGQLHQACAYCYACLGC